MAQSSKRQLWIGLAELRQLPGARILLDRNLAFTNVVGLAETEEEFRQSAKSAMLEAGFELLDMQDVEPFSTRRNNHSVDDSLVELADHVSQSGRPMFGALHTWISEE